MEEVNVVKLINGTTIIGVVETNADGYTIRYPLELVSTPITKQDVRAPLGEHMSIRPYLVMTDDDFVIIDRLNVISMSPLSQKFSHSYDVLVDHVYNEERFYDGDFLTGPSEDLERLQGNAGKELHQLTDEEREYLDSMIEKLIHGNKTIH
mgnify:CR=1 FL=1